jgi:putative intracellular protease/amidase
MPRIAVVVSTVGFHWEEVFGGYWTFRDAGCHVDVFTVGGLPRVDPRSVARTGPGALLGLGTPARIAPDTARGQELVGVMAAAESLDALDADRYDALYLPGGHGCLFDMNRDRSLHAIIARMYRRGAVLSGVCHATSTFAFVRDGERSIVQGHRMTGFPHALDRLLIRLGLVDEQFLPLPLINDQELRRAGAVLTTVDAALATVNPTLHRVSLPFVTGTGPKAAAIVAGLVVDTLATGAMRRRRPIPVARGVDGPAMAG